MKKNIIMTMCLLCMSMVLWANSGTVIKVSTDDLNLIYKVADNGRLYQHYFGKKLNHESDIQHLPQGIEAYLTHGMEDYFEPALHINHPDGNRSTLLKYVSHTATASSNGSIETVITLADPVYGDEVRLHYTAYPKENVITQYAEITNKEKKPIELVKYASSLLSFDREKYFLTEYHGDWISEVTLAESELTFGKKVIDTKLGARQNMLVQPFFQVAFDKKATETEGEVLLGTLAWMGNFQYTFEVDNFSRLRILSGINPYNSEYTIKKGETFTTPELVFTLSHNGLGQASRNLHRWARNHYMLDGNGDRMTLLNNWEATYFDFDEEKLCKLIADAKKLGVDMFLLDDGWFGNKYPRHSDTQGLGDWQETKNKLPNGIGRLTEEAKKQGVKFGIWIEPEMVNPKSELYEQHKDWVIHLPNRDEYYFRNQLVLDLSNPEVQDYVFGVVDGLMTKYPDIAFFKWDCNSPITNIHSAYLKNEQNRLYIEYTKGLYNVLERVKAKYPHLDMMMCSGGGGRSDISGLKYFREMWPSDNTDPIDRLFIQWGYSHFFPTKVLCAHVTSWNKNASVKFRTDVAMMGKLGFDIRLDELSGDDLAYCQRAVKNYNRLKPAILDGDIFRLVSPYNNEHTASMYVTQDKSKAVLFAFDLLPLNVMHNLPVCLQGLDANAQYAVKEINTHNGHDGETKVYSGEYLMQVGLKIFSTSRLSSRVYEITKQ